MLLTFLAKNECKSNMHNNIVGVASFGNWLKILLAQLASILRTKLKKVVMK